MKVLHQIIDYLDRRGALSQQQMAYLLQEGYLQRPDEPLAELDEAKPEAEAETLERRLERAAASRASAGKRRGGVGGTGPVALEPRQIEAWLASQIGAWREPLGALTGLARGLAGAAGLREAPRIVGETPAEALEAALAEALAARKPSLRRLWPAIALDGPARLLEVPEARGPAAGAYRAILTGRERNELGKHAWILKRPRIRWVYQLARAQRRLLGALWSLHGTRTAVLAEALRKGGTSGAYWTFVALYNAVRWTRRGPADAAPDERPPVREPPAPELWTQALGLALLAEPGPVTRFLSERSDPKSGPTQPQPDLLCPRAWDW
jgi:hypothetical protein